MSFKISSTLTLAVVAALGTVAPATAQNYPGLWTASEAVPDSYAIPGLTPHAMMLDGERYAFTAGGRFLEANDGTASLTGLMESKDYPEHKFAVKIILSNRVGMNAPVPDGSPKKELIASAYAPGGGGVDTSSWRYYLSWDVELTGVGAYEGARVNGSRVGPAFQIGVGASGKNIEYGGSGWFTTTVVSQPRYGSETLEAGFGDFNIDLGGDGKYCAYDFNDHDGAHALWIADNRFLFVGGSGRMIEKADGTAKLTGLVAHADNPNQRLRIDVNLGGLVAASVAPPAGSPKLDLPGNLYVSGGGDIDPSGWYYYTTLDGVLKGEGSLYGAMIKITRTGPAFQIGFGADGKGPVWGGSGWLDVNVVCQPRCGRIDGWTFGDFNLRLGKCTDPKFTICSPERARAGRCRCHYVTVKGPMGTRYRPLVFASTSNGPRILNRFIKLDIGRGGRLCMLRRGCFNRSKNSWHYRVCPPRYYRGRTLHFQAAICTYPRLTPELPVTNVSSTRYH